MRLRQLGVFSLTFCVILLVYQIHRHQAVPPTCGKGKPRLCLFVKRRQNVISQDELQHAVRVLGRDDRRHVRPGRGDRAGACVAEQRHRQERRCQQLAADYLLLSHGFILSGTVVIQVPVVLGCGVLLGACFCRVVCDQV